MVYRIWYVLLKLITVALVGFFRKHSNLVWFFKTLSYRSKSPLKIVAELSSWERHSDEEINYMLTSLKKLSEEGKNVIYD